jgi:hypothetical protein
MPKFIKYLFTTLLVTAPFVVASCGYKVNFYNFESYSSPQAQKIINKKFKFKEYGDDAAFIDLFKNQKIIGGISSTSTNVKLIKEGYASKIDFSYLFPQWKNKTKNEINTLVEKLYIPEVKNLMDIFDSYLGDVDGDGQQDHV